MLSFLSAISKRTNICSLSCLYATPQQLELPGQLKYTAPFEHYVILITEWQSTPPLPMFLDIVGNSNYKSSYLRVVLFFFFNNKSSMQIVYCYQEYGHLQNVAQHEDNAIFITLFKGGYTVRSMNKRERSRVSINLLTAHFEIANLKKWVLKMWI